MNLLRKAHMGQQEPHGVDTCSYMSSDMTVIMMMLMMMYMVIVAPRNKTPEEIACTGSCNTLSRQPGFQEHAWRWGQSWAKTNTKNLPPTNKPAYEPTSSGCFGKKIHA